MQIALNVNESTSDQLPTTTTESTSSVQQTGGTEGLTAPSQPNTTSAAEQQQLMNFLHSEAAGSVYTDSTNQGNSTGQNLLRLGIGTLIVVVAIGLAIVCQQQFNKISKPPKSAPKRRSSKKKA